MNTKKLTLIAILTAVALIIFIIEAQIPLPIPIPGVKLGLANAVTLFALFYKRETGAETGRFSETGDGSLSYRILASSVRQRTVPCLREPPCLTVAFAVLLCRLVLGAIFTGRLVAFAYSLTGGLFGFAAQVVMKRFVSSKQIWVCGAVGAVFHNIGQILAAMLITGTPSIAAYLPVLIIAGIFTGVITGFIAQFTIERIFGKKML
ncbi:MAG: Gx transporter family protein [Oscillospiraceae bacterium]|nr:Gx transporter family protein [Oscillospiraceae bacterium]